MDQGFTCLPLGIWNVHHVCPGYFDRNAMSGRWSIHTDESLVGPGINLKAKCNPIGLLIRLKMGRRSAQ
jgi:hypothetical protein